MKRCPQYRGENRFKIIISFLKKRRLEKIQRTHIYCVSNSKAENNHHPEI